MCQSNLPLQHRNMQVLHRRPTMFCQHQTQAPLSVLERVLLQLHPIHRLVTHHQPRVRLHLVLHRHHLEPRRIVSYRNLKRVWYRHQHAMQHHLRVLRPTPATTTKRNATVLLLLRHLLIIQTAIDTPLNFSAMSSNEHRRRHNQVIRNENGIVVCPAIPPPIFSCLQHMLHYIRISHRNRTN